MTRRLPMVIVAAALLGCTGNANTLADAGDDGGAGGGSVGGGGGGGGGGAAGGGGGNVGGGGGGAFDAGTITPPPATCTPPLMPADTSRPTTVVGTGTPASCTEAALRSAVAAGGIVTFNCGGAATIALTQTLAVPTDKDTVVDGAGLITLDGQNQVRLFEMNHANYRVNDRSLTLQRLTLTRGRATGTRQYPSAPPPCSQGFYDGSGGAVYVRDGVLRVFDCTFLDNHAAPLGPDVGGGAIYLAGAKRGLISGCTFKGNDASNGGAVGVLNSDLDVYNSTFEGNAALGNGANSDDAMKCSVLDPVTMQHQVGSGGNGGAICIDGGSDGTKTFCGVRFVGNRGGADALGGAVFRTPDAAKQTTVIDRCTFDGNTSPMGGGGAAYFHNSTLQIRASAFVNNSAKGPGAIQSDGTTVDFENVTFARNAATAGLGGALALFSGDGAIKFCTFANNTAEGGDPYFGAAITAFATLQIDGTLFANNTAANPGAPMQCRLNSSSGAGNLQWPRTHRVGGADDTPCTPNITFADPQLGSLADHGGPTPTVLPSATSPALNAATNCPATDQRGRARSANMCTAGAAEGST